MADSTKICEHLQAVTELKFAEKHECSECVKVGGKWVHLRTCQSCGKTLCCDSSPAQHMSRHSEKTGHPVAISAESGERWLWCYIDEELAKY